MKYVPVQYSKGIYFVNIPETGSEDSTTCHDELILELSARIQELEAGVSNWLEEYGHFLPVEDTEDLRALLSKETVTNK